MRNNNRWMFGEHKALNRSCSSRWKLISIWWIYGTLHAVLYSTISYVQMLINSIRTAKWSVDKTLQYRQDGATAISRIVDVFLPLRYIYFTAIMQLFSPLNFKFFSPIKFMKHESRHYGLHFVWSGNSDSWSSDLKTASPFVCHFYQI